MTTDDTPTITEQLIEAVRTTPGAGSGYIARAIGSDDIHTCAALLFKLVKRGVLRREGEPRAYRYYIGDVDPSQQPESTSEEPAAQGADAASTGPTWSRPAPETCDDDDDIDDEDDDDDSIDDKTRETGEALSDALRDAIRKTFNPLNANGDLWTLVLTEHGRLSFVDSDGPIVTLTPEQTRRVGRFMAFTLPLWEPKV
jgi:hypothetical protein